MPQATLTPTESVLLDWLRGEMRRLAADPDDHNCAVVILGRPEPAMMLIHEVTEHSPGVQETGDGEYLINADTLSAYATHLA